MTISAKLFSILTTGFRGEDFLKFSHRCYSTIGGLSSHAHNWFLSLLALQETGTLRTTRGCSDRIAE